MQIILLVDKILKMHACICIQEMEGSGEVQDDKGEAAALKTAVVNLLDSYSNSSRAQKSTAYSLLPRLFL